MAGSVWLATCSREFGSVPALAGSELTAHTCSRIDYCFYSAHAGTAYGTGTGTGSSGTFTTPASIPPTCLRAVVAGADVDDLYTQGLGGLPALDVHVARLLRRVAGEGAALGVRRASVLWEVVEVAAVRHRLVLPAQDQALLTAHLVAAPAST